MTFIRLAALGTLGALALGGCATPESPVAGPASPVRPAATSSTPGHEEDHHHALAAATAGWPAEKVATKVVDAWSRRDVSADDWWAELEPLLSPAGVQNYAYTDPANVPELVRSGAPQLVHQSRGAASVASVRVPTSLGPFTVELTRQAADTGWLARSIEFPADLVAGGTL